MLCLCTKNICIRKTVCLSSQKAEECKKFSYTDEVVMEGRGLVKKGMKIPSGGNLLVVGEDPEG